MTATEVKERPIIFSASMVRAILEGRKTQTRRAGAIQSDEYTELATNTIGHQTKGYVIHATYRAFPGRGSARWAICEFPYGVPGDRLWVRETWMPVDPAFVMPAEWENKLDRDGERHQIAYRADGDYHADWNSPIHMPRWASRITLGIADVRVQRVQEISHDDAVAEGMGIFPISMSAQKRFAEIWNSINGKKYPWASNPWVWAITFKRIKKGSAS